MRVHTLLGVLLALIVTVLVAYLTQENTELLRQPFQLTETATMPVYAILIAVFLVGFLPVVTLLVVRTLAASAARSITSWMGSGRRRPASSRRY